jgi:hypothetical protein
MLIALPLQQWLQERFSILIFMYNAFLVERAVTKLVFFIATLFIILQSDAV